MFGTLSKIFSDWGLYVFFSLPYHQLLEVHSGTHHLLQRDSSSKEARISKILLLSLVKNQETYTYQ